MAALDGVNGTVCNAQQYQLSIPSPDNLNPSISCLTHGQAIGLAVGIPSFSVLFVNSFRVQLTAEASFLSFVSVLAIYVVIGVSLTSLHASVWFDEMLAQWNIRWYRRNVPRDEWRLFQGPTDIYMVCLMVFCMLFTQLIYHIYWQFTLFAFDLLQAMGGIFDVRWAHNGIVTTGPYCTAQGVVQQIGELGVALITLVCLFSPPCLWARTKLTNILTRLSPSTHSWLPCGAWDCKHAALP